MQALWAVSLVVPDHDAAIAVCVGKLGFTQAGDADPGGGKRWVRVLPLGAKTGGLILALSSSAVQ